jgi:hypothetical protein
MEGQQLTDLERMERICARLEEKARASDKLDEPLLGPPGCSRCHSPAAWCW